MESKLVSKSPILRFKLGRKIVKALWGSILNRYSSTILGAINPAYALKLGMSIPNYNRLFFSKVGKYLTTPQTNGVTPGGKIYQSESSTTTPKNTPPNYSFMNKVHPMTLDGYSNQTKVLQPQKSVVKSPVNNVWIKGYDKHPEINDVRAMQLKLADMGLLKSRFGVDGKWGGDTEAAYLKYLALKTIPTMDSKPVEMVSPAQLMGIYSEENMPLHLKIGMVLKKGGRLPSRNPVKRFKSNVNFFRLEVQ